MMTDYYELINIRLKEVAVAFLDSQKIASKKATWPGINLILPMIFLGIFGFTFHYFRRKKYA